jgi:hypothetical protein
MRVLLAGLFFFAINAFAAGASSGYSIGFNLGIVNASQNQMNDLIKRANTREGGISTSEMNQAYELQGFIMYRFSNPLYALQLRPSYYYQVEEGSGGSGGFNYSLTGFTLFPILRLYPLENEFMKFYMQAGVGYGMINGKIEEGTAKVEFSGGAFGTMAGMGAEFCFNASHCLSFEGDYRYLTFQRFTADSSSGTFAADSLTQYSKGSEIEMDNSDVSARMGGLMFMAGYTMWF